MPVVNGNQFANTLQGDQDPGDPNDTISGFGGDDTLSGGGGNNQLNGGFDTDTADYTFVSPIFGPPVSGVNVDLAAGTATNPFGGTDALSGIEDVIGTDAADTIRGDGNDNRLEGRGGGDTLEGRGGADTLLGQAGADSLDGGAGDDSLDGGAGNDTLVGGPGVDTATGGPGNDVFRFGPGDLAPIFPPLAPSTGSPTLRARALCKVRTLPTGLKSIRQAAWGSQPSTQVAVPSSSWPFRMALVFPACWRCSASAEIRRSLTPT